MIFSLATALGVVLVGFNSYLIGKWVFQFIKKYLGDNPLAKLFRIVGPIVGVFGYYWLFPWSMSESTGVLFFAVLIGPGGAILIITVIKLIIEYLFTRDDDIE